MKNPTLRKALSELLEDAIILDSPSFDYSIIGYTGDGRLAYSLEKMVRELSQDDNLSKEEALDFIEYNTYRSLPYMGDRAPAIITAEGLEELLDENIIS